VVQRFEQRLGGLVEGAFARVFKGEVQPVEVAGALRREADARRTIVDADRILTVNAYTIRLGDQDFRRLDEWADPLTRELATMLREHASEERYSFVGPLSVTLEHDPAIPTGTFRIDSAMAAGATATPPSAAVSTPGPAGASLGRHDVITVPAASPASGRPRLSLDGREQPLTGRVTVIGRGGEADIRVEDPGVSRRHAEVHVVDDDVEVLDAGSTNGTKVNGTAISRARLVDGDQITVGSTTIRFNRDRG
jgi:hypothetical protein